MSPEDEKRYNALAEMFLTEGWRLLMEEMKEARDSLVAGAWALDDERQLYRRKGEIFKLCEFISYEETTKLLAREDDDAEREAMGL